MTATRVFVRAFALLLLLPHERAHSQGATRPGWLAREPTRISHLTPAQLAAAIARLEQLERLVLQISEIARPEGFEVTPRFYGGAKILHPDEKQRAGDVVSYEYGLMFFAPSFEIAGEGSRCIQIRINPTLEAQHTTLRDARGNAISIELARGKLVPFATQVYGTFDPSPEGSQLPTYVLFTSGGELPWRQVTRDEFYDASILFHHGKDGSEMAQVRKSLEKTPYEQWLAGAPQRKRDREEALKTAAGIQPAAEVAKLRKMLEATEREVGENLKKSEADDRATDQANLAGYLGIGDSMIAERNRMSGAERCMPAAVDNQGAPAGATGRALADPNDPTALRVLTPNYDFWRARKSRDEVRAIEVELRAAGTCANPAVRRAMWEVYQKLDWAALNRMLAVPRT
jgi:hypothetical protein